MLLGPTNGQFHSARDRKPKNFAYQNEKTHENAMFHKDFEKMV